MGDIDITNGSTEKIINRQQAARVINSENDVTGYLLYTDGDIRLAHETEQQEAQHALPIKAGTYIWDLDPRGDEMYAYNDESSGSVTVSVTPQKYSIGEMG